MAQVVLAELGGLVPLVTVKNSVQSIYLASLEVFLGHKLNMKLKIK